jgi:RimJ/RimL family protein N-acetyltransferase
MNSDASTRRLKGKGRPFNGEKSRAAVLAALACVDFVVVFDSDTPYELIAKIKPDVLIKGADYKNKGVVWGCAGFVKMHNGRAAAWAYIANGLGMRDMALLTRAVKLQLAVTEFNRIEIYVDCEFEKAHNWARHLGFTMECERMKSFTPDKRDCALYAMVRS